MIAIGSNGAVAVAAYCHNVGPGMVSPIIVVVVSADGRDCSDAPRRNYEKPLTIPAEVQPRNTTRADLIPTEGFGLEVDSRMKMVFPTRL